MIKPVMATSKISLMLIVQRIPLSEVPSASFPYLISNVRLPPPPLTPPAKGGEFRATTNTFLPLDGGGEVGVITLARG
jgi:hypothetical protein